MNTSPTSPRRTRHGHQFIQVPTWNVGATCNASAHESNVYLIAVDRAADAVWLGSTARAHGNTHSLQARSDPAMYLTSLHAQQTPIHSDHIATSAHA